MRTISLQMERMKYETIPLGFEGENEFTQVRIDCRKTYDAHPDAAAALKVRNPVGTEYPATVTKDGNEVVWNVTASDLTARGTGEIQLMFTIGSTVIGMSDSAKTRIDKSITGSGTAPDPVQGWVDEANEVLEQVQEAIPAGGTTGQVLAKKTNADRDLEWVDQTGGGGTSDYDQLQNRPQIGGVTLTGNKSLAALGIASTTECAAKYTKPGTGIPASDIASGVIPDVSGFYTKPAGGIPADDIAAGVIPDVSGFYTKPAGGIPADDLASGVIPYEAPWELIREDTFTNATQADYDITVDGNGNPFELTSVRMVLWFPTQSNEAKTAAGLIVLKDTGNTETQLTTDSKTVTANSSVQVALVSLEQDHGMYVKTSTPFASDGNLNYIRIKLKQDKTAATYPYYCGSEKVFIKISIRAVTGTMGYRIYGRRKQQ